MAWFFFGCESGSNAGHRLVSQPGLRMDQGRLPENVRKFMEAGSDDVLRPFFSDEGWRGSGKVYPYQACVTRFGGFGYSALSWIDYSADSRPGSNAIVWAPSDACSVLSIYRGFARFFPEVEGRFRRTERFEPSIGGSPDIEGDSVVVDRRVWIPGSVASRSGRAYFRDENNDLLGALAPE